MTLEITVEGEASFRFALDEALSEAWLLQRLRMDDLEGRVTLQERLASCIATSLLLCLDDDLVPPTPAQLIYATDIARELGVSLPFEALRYRGAMSDFIGRYVDIFRDQRNRRRQEPPGEAGASR